ncbi:MAG TPA: DUF4410 domain-containing protein [Verrucomicrobiota bacterium]|nr:DUF4410 domain-containing protein [Verrucomicrobiota bacterium]
MLAALMLSGCASTKVTQREQLVNEKLPRPNRILVYDFVATPSDIPADSELAGADVTPATPQTTEEIAIGRKVGAEIAARLVEEIQEMGMPGLLSAPATTPQINDIVIRGYLVSINQGSAAKRVGIGLGAGSSELKVLVEGYQMTPSGLRKLGSGMTDSTGSKTPGAAVGLAGLIVTGNPVGLIVSGGMKVYGEASGSSKIEGRAKKTAQEIAQQLEIRFKEQGWIR